MRPSGEVALRLRELSLDESASRTRPLPTVNFLDIDPSHADAIIMEALEEDRPRFRRYLSDRPLGLAMITAVSYYTSFPVSPQLTQVALV